MVNRPLLPRRCQHILDVERAQVCKEQEQAHSHGRIPHPSDDKSLACRVSVGRIFVPETNQQVAAQAHAFPAQVEQEQVVGQHQHQHHADKQVHIGKEAVIAFVIRHVFG
jgi:hypothetical protein